MSQQQGQPISESAMPAWARPYLSEGQRELQNRALQWVLMFDHTAYLPSSARDLCRRLHIATLGNDDKVVFASQATLSRWTGWSEETVRTQLAQLDADGWISFTPGAGTRRTRIRLTWPATDPNTQLRDDPDKCMSATVDQNVCMRRAGWGTTTPGIGPCKLHGGTPKNPAKKPPTPQPLGESSRPPQWPIPQPLGDWPVDNHADRADDSRLTPQRLGGNAPTVGVATPQPLGGNPPTVGPPYVREYVRVSVESENTGCSDHVAEVEDPPDPERSSTPDFCLDDVKMADGWRAIARRKLGVDLGEIVDPEYLEAYATALALAEITSGTFRAPPWPDPARIPA